MTKRSNLIPMCQEIERFWSRVDCSGNCWEWTGRKDSYGYGQFDHHNSCSRSHRYSWSLVHGEIPEGMVICHSCDNPGCVNPDHLFLGTVQDNVADRDRKGKQANRRGEMNPKAKLNQTQVDQVRELRRSGWEYQQIADYFGVSNGCVNHIINNRHWSIK